MWPYWPEPYRRWSNSFCREAKTEEREARSGFVRICFQGKLLPNPGRAFIIERDKVRYFRENGLIHGSSADRRKPAFARQRRTSSRRSHATAWQRYPSRTFSGLCHAEGPLWRTEGGRGGIGIRAGLRILWVHPVRVQLPPSAQ